MHNRERIAYTKGRKARFEEVSKSDNPYREMTNMWSWWVAGWNDADIKIASYY